MRFVPALALILAAVAATGCGNYSGLKNKPIKPIAIIDGPGTGPATTTIELDGSRSYDPNALQPNGIFEWEWSLVTVPPGSAAAIDNDNGDPNNAYGELDADMAGVYVIQLRVRDINDYVWSDPTTYKLVVFPITGYTIELRWDTDINDVDLHLIDETAGGGLFDPKLDCFFQNLRPDWGTAGLDGDPSLNHDDVNGYGPETMIVAVPTDGEQYHAIVHYFSDDGYGETHADVRFWVNGSMVLEMERDITANQLWDLAIIDWTNVDANITRTDSISTY
jgi:hypothetical protein